MVLAFLRPDAGLCRLRTNVTLMLAVCWMIIANSARVWIDASPFRCMGGWVGAGTCLHGHLV